MRNVIETSCGDNSELRVEISDAVWGQENLRITKTTNPHWEPEVTAISFELDVDAARALAFSFGELAKTLGRRK